MSENDIGLHCQAKWKTPSEVREWFPNYTLMLKFVEIYDDNPAKYQSWVISALPLIMKNYSIYRWCGKEEVLLISGLVVYVIKGWGSSPLSLLWLSSWRLPPHGLVGMEILESIPIDCVVTHWALRYSKLGRLALLRRPWAQPDHELNQPWAQPGHKLGQPWA